LLAALVAYHNSFDGVFLYDDGPAIKDNPTITHLSNLLQVLSPPSDSGVTVNGRPLVNLSLAVNYAVGGTSVFGYHVFNFLVHVCAGLALFGLVRRSLQLPALRERFADDNERVLAALAVAAVWTLHPLQTQSVTYLIQRAESLVGLFYLMTLYCFVRSVSSARPGRWQAAGVLTCYCGMASKEVMASAPLLVLLYDRALVGGGFRTAWQRHRGFYLGLATSWVLLAALVHGSGTRGGTAGMGVSGIGSWDYALTQCLALGKYLKLAFWPSPLVFDYGVGLQRHLLPVLPQAILIVALVITTAFALWRRPVLGFLGMFFFAILGPSSSFIPIATEPIAEHRMYLPLAAVVSLVVLGATAHWGRRATLAFLGLAAVAVALTVRRNEDYRDELRLWSDVISKYPTSERAQNITGEILSRTGRQLEALDYFRRALRLEPNYIGALNNIGNTLLQLGQAAEARPYLERAVQFLPTNAEGFNGRGQSYYLLSRRDEAIASYREALKLRPSFAIAHNNLGLALAESGRLTEAMHHYEEALRLKENYPDAHLNYGNALRETGRLGEAAVEYRKVLQLQPAFAKAHNNLGTILWTQGQRIEAQAHFAEAVQQQPDYVDALNNLGLALFEAGKLADALGRYQAAHRIAPESVPVRNRLATTYSYLGAAAINEGRLGEARQLFENALNLSPADPNAYNNLGTVLSRQGDLRGALKYFDQAVKLKPDFAPARETAAAIREQLQKLP
jgi:tetratricopeptide (TPR) repeat protein